MIVGTCYIQLHLPAAHSLKDKRSVVKSVLQRLRNEFNISAAEVADQDLHQRAGLGVAAVSGSGEYVRGQLEAVVRWIEEHRPDVEVLTYDIELL